MSLTLEHAPPEDSCNACVYGDIVAVAADPFRGEARNQIAATRDKLRGMRRGCPAQAQHVAPAAGITQVFFNL